VADRPFADCTVWANLRIGGHVYTLIPAPLLPYAHRRAARHRLPAWRQIRTGGVRSARHFLRDHRTGDVHHFDPRLFDLLHDLTASLDDSGGEIDVICGYRTPRSNEFLRTRSPHTGVAQHSLHMQAEAIDIRLPGIPTTAVRDAALRLHRGGVGFYRSSNFVHVDVGRVRQW
jgi:uncharacterized protein YcbK (DUF882 family)